MFNIVYQCWGAKIIYLFLILAPALFPVIYFRFNMNYCGSVSQSIQYTYVTMVVEFSSYSFNPTLVQ